MLHYAPHLKTMWRISKLVKYWHALHCSMGGGDGEVLRGRVRENAKAQRDSHKVVWLKCPKSVLKIESKKI